MPAHALEISFNHSGSAQLVCVVDAEPLKAVVAKVHRVLGLVWPLSREASRFCVLDDVISFGGAHCEITMEFAMALGGRPTG
jgi:hypothetical protein